MCVIIPIVTESRITNWALMSIQLHLSIRTWYKWIQWSCSDTVWMRLDPLLALYSFSCSWKWRYNCTRKYKFTLLLLGLILNMSILNLELRFILVLIFFKNDVIKRFFCLKKGCFCIYLYVHFCNMKLVLRHKFVKSVAYCMSS